MVVFSKSLTLCGGVSSITSRRQPEEEPYLVSSLKTKKPLSLLPGITGDDIASRAALATQVAEVNENWSLSAQNRPIEGNVRTNAIQKS